MENKSVRVNIRDARNVRITELNPFQEDIKILTEENYQRLKEEILEDGFSFSPHAFEAEDGSLWILDGHQRYTCLVKMLEEGYSVPTIPVVIVEAENLEHARRLVMAGTSQYGTFQVKRVTQFIKKIGLPPEQVGARFNLPSIRLEKVAPHQRLTDTAEYSKKIKAPIYEPKGEKPEEHQLFDQSKTMKLCAKIQSAELPQQVQAFLIAAAQRHTVFDYEKIAEYYCHAPKEVQELMEESALVIIDFKKALENGFVTLTQEIAEAYTDEAE